MSYLGEAYPTARPSRNAPKGSRHLFLTRLYDALVQAGATNATAGDAAEEVAGFDTRRQAIERKLGRLEALQWATFVAAAAILARIYWP